MMTSILTYSQADVLDYLPHANAKLSAESILHHRDEKAGLEHDSDELTYHSKERASQ